MSSRYNLPFADVGSGIKPSSGAKLFFFEPDGVTPKDTFSDQLSTPTPNTNPVIADSNGVFGDIFINGEYKNTLKDKNDVQIFGGVVITEPSTVESTDAHIDRLNPDTLAIAIADSTLEDEDALHVKEQTTGNKGGRIFDVVLKSTVTVDNLGIFASTGDLTLALVQSKDLALSFDNITGVIAAIPYANGTEITTGNTTWTVVDTTGLSIGGGQFLQKRNADDLFRHSNPLGNKLQLIAHRGMAFQFPENTMVAFASSISLGVDGIEGDISTSSDGVHYLFHDVTVDVLTNGTGIFTELTSTTIDALTFTSTVSTILADERIPRLTKLLELARREGMNTNLELKNILNNTTDIDAVIAEIVAAECENIVSLQSGSLANTQYIRTQNSQINVGFITADSNFVPYLDTLGDLGNTTVVAQHDMIFANPGFVKYARDRGVDIVAFTVNDVIFARRIQEIGVYKIMSDRLTGELQR